VAERGRRPLLLAVVLLAFPPALASARPAPADHAPVTAALTALLLLEELRPTLPE